MTMKIFNALLDYDNSYKSIGEIIDFINIKLSWLVKNDLTF